MEHLEDEDAERPPIAGLVDAMVEKHLGRRVVGRGQPEVRQAAVAPARRPHAAAAAAGAAAQYGKTTTPHLHRRPLRAKSTEELSEEALDGSRIDLFRNGRGRTKRR